MNFALTRMTAALLLAGVCLQATAAQDVDIDQVRAATSKLIGLLAEQGVLAPDKAESLLKDVTRPASPAVAGSATSAAAPASKPGTVRVPYIPEFVRKELKDELRAELAAQAQREGWAGPGSVPEWVRGLKWDGDLRVRYQYDNYAEDNAPSISINETNRTRSLSLLNTSEDRQRLRVRARLGLTSTIDENWAAGVRLTTGSTTDPISSNQTLGIYNNRYTVAIDRAYLRYRQAEQFNVVAGRFGNPWYGTDLLWANDLGFDGIAGQWTPKIGSAARGFVTLAVMPVQEVELASADKWLFGAQAGIDTSNLFGVANGKLALGFYRYSNMIGKTSPAGSSLYEYTAPQFAQKGNTYYNISSDPNRPLLAMASDYRLINVTGQTDFEAMAGKRVILTADYVRNLGFDRAAVSARLGVDVQPMTNAFHLRAAFGDAELKAARDWQVYIAYKRIERDALPDAFTDGDFRLGGTDAKGYILGASYAVGKNTAASFKYFSGDSVSGAPLSVDVIQFDLTSRF